MTFPELLPLLFFVPAMLVIGFVISQTSGWAQLSKTYKLDGSYLGTWKQWQWGKIGWAAYKRCLWVGVDAQGLYLKIPALFCIPCHSPLSIPWSSIKSIERRSYWFYQCYEITLNDSPTKIMLEINALQGGERFFANKLKEN